MTVGSESGRTNPSSVFAKIWEFGAGTIGSTGMFKLLAGGGTFNACDTEIGEGFGASKVGTGGVSCGGASGIISGFGASIGCGVSIGFGSSILGLGTSMVRDRPSAIVTDSTASTFSGAGGTVSSFGSGIAFVERLGNLITGDAMVELGFCGSKTEAIPGGNSSSLGGVAGSMFANRDAMLGTKLLSEISDFAGGTAIGMLCEIGAVDKAVGNAVGNAVGSTRVWVSVLSWI